MSLPHPDIAIHCILSDNQGMTLPQVSQYLYSYRQRHNLPEHDNPKPVFNPADASSYLRLYSTNLFYEKLKLYAYQDDLGLYCGEPVLHEPYFNRSNFEVSTVTHHTLGPEQVRRRLVYGELVKGEIDFNESTKITRIIKDWGPYKIGRKYSYVEQPILTHQKREAFHSYEELIAKYPLFAIEQRFNLDEKHKIRLVDRDSCKFFRTIQNKDRFYFDEDYLRNCGPASSSLPNGGFGPLGWTDFCLSRAFVRHGYLHDLGHNVYHISSDEITPQIVTYYGENALNDAKDKGVNDPRVRKEKERGILDAMFSHYAKKHKLTNAELLRMRLMPWERSTYG
jgi:hypothetical protein